MNALTREQRMYAAAAASVLFIISLFFNWYGEGPIDASGTDVVPSWWLLLIFSGVSAALLVAEAVKFEVPAAIGNPLALAAYLSTISFIVTLMIFLEGYGVGRKFGIFLALLFSLVAAVLTVMHWRDEAK